MSFHFLTLETQRGYMANAGDQERQILMEKWKEAKELAWIEWKKSPSLVGLDLEKCSKCKLDLPFQTACLLIRSAQRPFAVCERVAKGRYVHVCVSVTVPEDATRTVMALNM